MSCRPLPHYRPGHGWMLGVALPSTLTSTRPAFRGFTRVRCCSLPPASSPHPLTESAVAFGSQLPPTDSAGDFHPQSIIHVQRTRAGILPAPQFVDAMEFSCQRQRPFRHVERPAPAKAGGTPAPHPSK